MSQYREHVAVVVPAGVEKKMYGTRGQTVVTAIDASRREDARGAGGVQRQAENDGMVYDFP